MKGTWLLFAFLCAAPAQAQTLQQCAGKDGTTAYRSGSCLPGERLVAVRDNPPEVRTTPAPEQALHESEPEDAKHASRNAGNYRHATRRASATRSRRATSTRGNPCASAKQARDEYQKRRGIRITMAELSRWNNRVYDACR